MITAGAWVADTAAMVAAFPVSVDTAVTAGIRTVPDLATAWAVAHHTVLAMVPDTDLAQVTDTEALHSVSAKAQPLCLSPPPAAPEVALDLSSPCCSCWCCSLCSPATPAPRTRSSSSTLHSRVKLPLLMISVILLSSPASIQEISTHVVITPYNGWPSVYCC
ncbi:uncharacterized protein LOC128223430 [Mya arenaria]|uniref:uncharacterized protein LOC128223430 n=1 Tax=Mya arenaria TaxID=6604 RepID=UPI0022E22D3B|nr:uncharacterized protein LOC128223430 [Mya arenaria]